LSSILEAIPGILGIVFLLYTGFKVEDCFLNVRKLSLKGAIILSSFFLLLVPIISSGKWVGFDALSFFVYSPISGITQELFFRAVLLVVFLNPFESRPFLAIVSHSAFFVLWHLPLVITTPLPGIVGVSLITFVGGIIWGWQVQHDRTLVWTAVQHVSYLMVMSLFVWG
jgi:hypothetical protein